MSKKEKEINTKHFNKSDLLKMCNPKNTDKKAKLYFKRKPYSIGNFIIN